MMKAYNVLRKKCYSGYGRKRSGKSNPGCFQRVEKKRERNFFNRAFYRGEYDEQTGNGCAEILR